MLQRKHIKAPTRHDPGKGFPTEHLAYLAPWEMELLRQLTDGTISRGPRGIPSFVAPPSGGGVTKTNYNSGPGTVSSSGSKNVGPTAGQGSNYSASSGYKTSSPASAGSKNTGETKTASSTSSSSSASKAPSSSPSAASKNTGPSQGPMSAGQPAANRGPSQSSAPSAASRNTSQGPTGVRGPANAAGMPSVTNPTGPAGAPSRPTSPNRGDTKRPASPMAGQGTSGKMPAALSPVAPNRPTLPTGTGNNPPYRNPNYMDMDTGKPYPSLARFSPNGTIMPTQGKIYPSGVPILAETPNFDVMKLNPAGQDIYRSLANTAIDTQRPITNFSGSRPRKSSKQHPAGVAVDMYMRDPDTGAPYKGNSFPLGNSPANRKALGPGYTAWSNDVIDTIYANPGNYPNLNPQEVRWGGNFAQGVPKDYMHFDAGEIKKGTKTINGLQYAKDVNLPDGKAQADWQKAAQRRANTKTPVDQGLQWASPPAVPADATPYKPINYTPPASKTTPSTTKKPSATQPVSRGLQNTAMKVFNSLPTGLQQAVAGPIIADKTREAVSGIAPQVSNISTGAARYTPGPLGAAVTGLGYVTSGLDAPAQPASSPASRQNLPGDSRSSSESNDVVRRKKIAQQLMAEARRPAAPPVTAPIVPPQIGYVQLSDAEREAILRQLLGEDWA